jgi:NAD(P)-dependent dehydrogenase (short-subunit alcohol dehydrogenase family)
VTGASSGLGKAIAAQFAASGASVALLARNQEKLTAAAREIGAAGGGRVEPIVCDVTVESAIDAAVATARERLGPIDILVNNAGSSFRQPLLEQSRAGVIADLELKLLAAIRFAQLVVPAMQERRWGRILNVVSIAAKAPGPASAPTTLSRAAGIALTKSLSHELAPWNILVNALCVGKIKSGQWQRRHAQDGRGLSYDEFLAPQAAAIPLGRLGEAEEFARVACFLASDAASYVTGVALNVDGGLSPVC